MLHAIIDRHLSVHQTEEMVKGLKKKRAALPREKKSLPELHTEAQQRLKERLQSVVEIRRSQRGKGTLSISFNSDSDFQRIISLLER